MSSDYGGTYDTWIICYNNRRNPTAVPCTIAQVRKMCAMFEAAFTGVKCRPEPISDGGVELTEWPGKQSTEEYKTFRFISSRQYPWIGEETRDDASFLLSNHGRVCIKLKAFDGAPAFSDAELAEFRRIFEEVVPLPDGWRYKTLPSARRLTPFRSA